METSSSGEVSAGTSGSGEGPSGSREESRGSSNRGEGSFVTLDSRERPEDPGNRGGVCRDLRKWGGASEDLRHQKRAPSILRE